MTTARAAKSRQPQLNQVVLGIVLDEQDRSIASFLSPGNTADVTTLSPVVERLRRRFGVDRICVVADRGMISAATITAFEAQRIDRCGSWARVISRPVNQ